MTVEKEPDKINKYVCAKQGCYLPAMAILGYAKTGAQTPRQVEAAVAKRAHWNKW